MTPSVLLCLLLILLSTLSAEAKQKGASRFEKRCNECKHNHCGSRRNDDNCIYQCVSQFCAEEVFGKNYLIEYGEVNYEKKQELEKCYTKRR